MAKKLGIVIENKEEKIGEKVEIDEDLAKRKVQNMINKQRVELKEFDEKTQNLRVEQGGSRSNIKVLQECLEEEFENNQNNIEINMQEDEEEFGEEQHNIFDNPNMEDIKKINAPDCFVGHLKAYQLKGLRWLDNLFEQGINGILADEMVCTL